MISPCIYLHIHDTKQMFQIDLNEIYLCQVHFLYAETFSGKMVKFDLSSMQRRSHTEQI